MYLLIFFFNTKEYLWQKLSSPLEITLVYCLVKIQNWFKIVLLIRI